MRGCLLAALVALAGCNQLLGIDDPPGDLCVGPCACRVDDDCGTHEFCHDQIKSRTCDCVAGYARGPADSCVWEGVVVDPGFTNAAAWTPTNQALVDDKVVGSRDPGVVLLGTGACGAAASQLVMMPRLARAEPLVAVITYRVVDMKGAAYSPAFGIRRSWSEGVPAFASSVEWTTERRCLGAGHYADPDSTGFGQEVRISIGHSRHAACGTETVAIDRFQIAAANPGECPPFGQVVNGLANEATGWIFGMNGVGASAGFAPGIGEDGSPGARMALGQRCNAAWAEVPLSPGLGSPMLSYYASSTPSTTVQAAVDLAALTDGVPGQTTRARFCVPAHLRGVAARLRVNPTYPTGIGLCADAVNAVAALDSVTLADNPACGTDPAIADPSFESGTLARQIAGAGARVLPTDQIADPIEGTRVLEMTASACPAAASAFVQVITPPPLDGAGGPAIAFWSRMTPGTNTSLQVRVDGGAGTPIPRDTVWHRNFVCLDPKLAGRAQEVRFDHATTLCPAGFSPETVYIDALEATHAPWCPPT